MRTPDLRKAADTFAAIVTQKRDVLGKEQQAVEKLNRAMSRFGYQIQSTNQPRSGKRRGRPPGSRNKQKRHTPRLNGVRRRGPGRPPLRKVA